MSESQRGWWREAVDRLAAWVRIHPSYPDEAVITHSGEEDMLRVGHLRALNAFLSGVVKSSGDTPRTDREVYTVSKVDIGFEVVNPALCRMIEEELGEALKLYHALLLEVGAKQEVVPSVLRDVAEYLSSLSVCREGNKCKELVDRIKALGGDHGTG
jgi:hypothetical protein